MTQIIIIEGWVVFVQNYIKRQTRPRALDTHKNHYMFFSSYMIQVIWTTQRQKKKASQKLMGVQDGTPQLGTSVAPDVSGQESAVQTWACGWKAWGWAVCTLKGCGRWTQQGTHMTNIWIWHQCPIYLLRLHHPLVLITKFSHAEGSYSSGSFSPKSMCPFSSEQRSSGLMGIEI